MSWWLVPLALGIGILLGMLGGGGAIMTIPVLVYLVGQPPKAASAGSLVVVLITAIVGVATHSRRSTVRWRDGVAFGALGTAGSVLGSLGARGIDDALLMVLFAALMFVVALLMWRRTRSRTAKPLVVAASDAQTQDLTEPTSSSPLPAPSRSRRRGLGTLVTTAVGVGLLTGFFGVGGGFAAVPALVLALGYAMPQAVATSLLVIAINSLVALATRTASGLAVDWHVILPFAVVAAVGTFIGARLNDRVPERVLQLLFIAMLLAIGLLVTVENLPALLS